MVTRRLFVCLASTGLFACGSTASDSARPTDPPSEAGAVSEPPPEDNPISLILPPFWDIPVTETGFGEPLPLGGVRVCVTHRRGQGESWEQFVPVDLPCATTVEGEVVVLPEVPPMSELIVTATMDGFMPRAFPTTTGQWDQIISTPVEVHVMHLFRRSAFERFLPGADLNKGVVLLVPYLIDYFYNIPQFTSLGGVTASLGAPGVGPTYYFHGGAVIPGATATVPGFVTPLNALSGMIFANLEEGEYRIEMSIPSLPLLWGSFTNAGFPEWGPDQAWREGVLRAPVLRGHYVTVATQSQCAATAPDAADTCVEPPVDAGAAEAGP